MVTSTITPATRSYLFLTSLSMRGILIQPSLSLQSARMKLSLPDQVFILLYIIWRGNPNILTVCFELTIVLFCDVVELMGIFLCA